MNATLTNKNGFCFDDAIFSTVEKAIKWAKGRGPCHLAICVDDKKAIYIDYKVIRNHAYPVEV